MKEFYYLSDEDQLGPFTLDELKTKNLTANTFIWTEGMPEWKLLKDIPELKSLLKPITPPPPPPKVNSLKTRKSSGNDHAKVLEMIKKDWAQKKIEWKLGDGETEHNNMILFFKKVQDELQKLYIKNEMPQNYDQLKDFVIQNNEIRRLDEAVSSNNVCDLLAQAGENKLWKVKMLMTLRAAEIGIPKKEYLYKFSKIIKETYIWFNVLEFYERNFGLLE